MKKTNAAIKAAGFLFFAALVAYLGVYVVQSVEDPFKTVQAVSYTILESADADGIVVRDEEVLYSVYNTVYITAEEGKRVTRGAQVASAFNSTEHLNHAVRLGELDAEIEQLQAMVRDGTSAEDMLKFDGKIGAEIITLKRAVYARRLDDAEQQSLKLRIMTSMGAGSRSDIEEQISRLTQQRDELQQGRSTDSVSITAPASGVFGSVVDGWETLGPGELEQISAAELKKLMGREMTQPAYALGKLVYGTKWYYAALVGQEECLTMRPGSRIRVLFGHYYSDEMTMTVESISSAEDGKCAVVFSCNNSMTDALTMRREKAQLIFVEQQGIRVPRKSIHVDDDGTCVFVHTGMQAERKSVEILRDYGDFYVVKSDSLRIGDDIIVNAKKLRDGKVIE